MRLAIVSHIPFLAKQLGRDIFEEKLSELALGLLTDPVFAIRVAARTNVKRLVEIIDHGWTQSKLLPAKLACDENYLRRMTCLFTIREMASSKSLESTLIDKLIPTVTSTKNFGMYSVNEKIKMTSITIAPTRFLYINNEGEVI